MTVNIVPSLSSKLTRERVFRARQDYRAVGNRDREFGDWADYDASRRRALLQLERELRTCEQEVREAVKAGMDRNEAAFVLYDIAGRGLFDDEISRLKIRREVGRQLS